MQQFSAKVLWYLNLLIEPLRYITKIGLFNYFKYRIAKRSEYVLLKLRHHPVWVRKDTPDLQVAVCCLIDGEFSSISRHLDKSFDGTIVDAGGYIGTAALALSEMFPNAQVITIEPSIENLEILKKNVSTNNNIHIVYGALVGKDVDVASLRNRGTGEWGFTTVEKPLDNEAAQVMNQTPAFTLRRLGVDLDSIGVLKVDIEGGELDLFTNDMDTLKNINIVAAELHDRIVMGCSEAFKTFSKDRLIFNDGGEKYLSIKKS